MTKITPLKTISAGYLGVEQLTANFEAIASAFNKTLSRDGSSPNDMLADLDMNSNRILNLPAPLSDLEPVRSIDLDNLPLVPGLADSAQAAANAAAAAAMDAQDSADLAAISAAQVPEAFGGTSTSSVSIGLGTKTFTTQANKFFEVGSFILVCSNANPDNKMFGVVTSYSGTTLEINVTRTRGTGTFALWDIYVSGIDGSDGVLNANANDIPYDNSTSGLTATNVQEAVDELVDELVDGLAFNSYRKVAEIIYPVSAIFEKDKFPSFSFAIAKVLAGGGSGGGMTSGVSGNYTAGGGGAGGYGVIKIPFANLSSSETVTVGAGAVAAAAGGVSGGDSSFGSHINCSGGTGGGGGSPQVPNGLGGVSGTVTAGTPDINPTYPDGEDGVAGVRGGNGANSFKGLGGIGSTTAGQPGGNALGKGAGGGGARRTGVGTILGGNGGDGEVIVELYE